MKVKELKELLSNIDDDYEVVLSKDGEGNGFSPLADYMMAEYEPETTWCGEIWSEEDSIDAERKHNQNAIVLWPTN